MIEVKQQGVQDSQKAEDIFSRVFALFSLFVLAIGLLLIFLIFVLLAAERRVEMGMARAIGVQRRHLVLMFLFEGTVYDLLASFIGMGIGVGVGALLVTYLGPILERFDFPLRLTFQPRSLIIAYCLGVIFTFFSVAISSWLVSRMTVVEALRNLPESGRQASSLGELCVRLLELVGLLRKGHHTGRGEDVGYAVTANRGPLWSPVDGTLDRTDAVEGEEMGTTGDHKGSYGKYGSPAQTPTTKRGTTTCWINSPHDKSVGYAAALQDDQKGSLPYGTTIMSPQKPILEREASLASNLSSGQDGLPRISPRRRRRVGTTTCWINPHSTAVALDQLLGLVRALTQLGFLPLLAGYWLMQLGLNQVQIAFFSLGLTLIVIGGGLLIKAAVEEVVYLLKKQKVQTTRILAALAGLAILAYWALPFDVLAGLGLPRFHAGLEVFFLAALMMVFGAAWALISNAELLVGPLLALCSWQPGLHIMTRLASAYPLHHRFRTGLSVVMFSLVIFTMTVMAIITNATQNTYTNIDTQTGGYDIQAVAYFKPLPVGDGHSGPDISSVLASHGIAPQDFASIGVSTATAVGVIQPGAKNPAWHLYPAQVVSGGFLKGLGLHLMARAQGFDSDGAVWQALQANSHYALIDSSALPFNPNSLINASVYDPNAPLPADAGSPVYPPGLDPYYTFAMDGIYQGDTRFAPTTVWVASIQNRSAIKLTIIGVVDNSDSAHFGIYIPRVAYGTIHSDPSMPEAQTYYFKVAPGQDKRALALALGSAFLDNGLETTVLEDAIWQLRGPRILLSDILLGVVGMALLLGVAALAITGTRAVIERRQQIGMLRALGCSRRLLQGAFLCESFLVGCIGSLLGVILGVILARNIFAVNFFERYQTGLTFGVPWGELGLIVGIAMLASLLAALLPAWQAGRVTPIEAIRSG